MIRAGFEVAQSTGTPFHIHVAEGQYEVRVRLTDAGGVGNNYTSELTWSQLRSYQPDTANYTGRKRIAAKVLASTMSSGTLAQWGETVRAATTAGCVY